MKTAAFLLELGTCELPPGNLEEVVGDLAKNIVLLLKEQGLNYSVPPQLYYTPRRLAIWFKDLSLKAIDQPIELKGPSLELAFIENRPTKAGLQFAKICQTSITDLGVKETKKGKYLFYRGIKPGLAAEILLPEIIERAVKALSLPREMYWGNGVGPFLRPLRWVVALLGEKVLPVSLFGIKGDRITYGHRFLAPKAIRLVSAEDYLKTLSKAYVLVNPKERRDKIVKEIKILKQVVLDQELLKEVTNLVEFPVVLEGNFDPNFLDLPMEIIAVTLKQHQKCFVEQGAKGEKLAKFAIVSNLISKNPQEVIKGNEKVVGARLADAAYFYAKDKQYSLFEHAQFLEKRVFQRGLGSLADKAKRLVHLLEDLVPEIDGETRKMAALLAKADLSTNLVNEFPELQGVVGYYLIRDQNREVAKAIREHYLPRFAEDILPESGLGLALALADRLDSLSGGFILGKKPTGAKDPFGFRRMAWGIIRLIFKWQRPLDLRILLSKSLSYYGKEQASLVDELLHFIFDRLASSYPNNRAFRVVSEGSLSDLLAMDKAIQALTLEPLPTWLVIYKRIIKLLGGQPLERVNIDLKWLQTEEERELYYLIKGSKPILEKLWEQQNFGAYLAKLAEFTLPLENFFNTTIVIASEETLRNNRLSILSQILSFFQNFGNFSHLL